MKHPKRQKRIELRTYNIKPIILKTIILAAILTTTIPACKPKPASQPIAETTHHTDTIPQKTIRTDTIPPQQVDTGYIPAPTGFVNDFVRLFTPAQAKNLDSLVRNYEKKTTVEIAIVTLDSNMVMHQDFDAYTLRLANSWKVGKKATNNGIVMAIAPYMRKIRISNGAGIEKKLSDAETRSIIDNIIVPNFKKGDFYEGVRQGLMAIFNKLDAK